MVRRVNPDKPMRLIPTRTLALVLSGGLLGLLPAAESYEESLSAGDAHRAAGEAEKALAEYEEALGQASNETEKALALGKQGVVQAFDEKDYAAAAKLADEALALEGIAAVAEVTALQVRAECEAKGEKNHARAANVLEEALKLEGVDWSRPGLLLSLGDARRHLGKFDEAISAYEEVLGIDGVSAPMKAVAHLNIGLTWQYDLRKPDKARESYASAVELNEALGSEVEEHLGRLGAGTGND